MKTRTLICRDCDWKGDEDLGVARQDGMFCPTCGGILDTDSMCGVSGGHSWAIDSLDDQVKCQVCGEVLDGSIEIILELKAQLRQTQEDVDRLGDLYEASIDRAELAEAELEVAKEARQVTINLGKHEVKLTTNWSGYLNLHVDDKCLGEFMTITRSTGVGGFLADEILFRAHSPSRVYEGRSNTDVYLEVTRVETGV